MEPHDVDHRTQCQCWQAWPEFSEQKQIRVRVSPPGPVGGRLLLRLQQQEFPAEGDPERQAQVPVLATTAVLHQPAPLSALQSEQGQEGPGQL